ncbi:MAG: hypothetical protein V4722_06885 [Bacteroidota bacterium]
MDEKKIIFHDLALGTEKKPLWRHWGYSKELEKYAYRPADACDLCGSATDILFKTICHCGLGRGREVMNYSLGLNGSWSPENGDFTFYSCQPCTEKLAAAIQSTNTDLLNHEILRYAVDNVKRQNNNQL